jgi:hypothetical protein
MATKRAAMAARKTTKGKKLHKGKKLEAQKPLKEGYLTYNLNQVIVS